MLIGREEIRRRIPHAADMCLLESVTCWDARSIECVAISHRTPTNPLRSNDRLSIVCGVEYAAQAMALHGGLAAGASTPPRAGYLASVRDCRCSVTRLDTLSCDLTVRALQVFDDGQRVIYEFTLHAAGEELLCGRAAVVLDAGAP